MTTARRVFKVGDRACWSASPTSAECRRVYTGTITKDGGDWSPANKSGGWVEIVDDGFGATSQVGKRFLHTEGAYEITDSGPVGIYWKD